MLFFFLIPLLFSGSLAALDVDERSRVDCFPEPGASQQTCEQRGCIWKQASQSAPVGAPWCYYPRESGFKVFQQNANYYQLVEGTSNPYVPNISPIDVKVANIGKTLTVTIGTSSRYVPPVNLPKNPTSSPEDLQFVGSTVPNSDFFAFQVKRASTGTHLWDTSIGGMQFGDSFIQIATYLPSANVFGFGDHIHHNLRHNMSRYTVWPMFARDIAPNSESELSTQNLYGVHPFYMVVEGDGKAHGVFILNSNAQEVMVGPGPHLVYRTIGGQLDISFFPGPTPEAVVQQYLAHIGTPFLPAYWALGYQLCRWGYKNLTDMENVISRVQAAGIPLDVPYADIDYMNHYEDFTEGDKWKDFPAYADKLHSEGLHLIIIFDPAVEVDYGSFQRAIQQNASFIEWATAAEVPHEIQDQYPMAKNTQVMLGNVWPDRNTAFPDFLDTSNVTNDWWSGEFQKFHQTLRFDGIWIDMNEPSNFDTDTHSSPKESRSSAHLSCPITGQEGALDNPPYQTYAVYNHQGEHLCSKTLCMLGKTARRTQNFYDTKNLYGWSESRATAQALRQTTGKRGAVISRSTFPSSGRFGGHWLGDNTARWADLRTSVVGAMEYNMFGIPYVGSDICGFIGVTTEELCLRWHQMGAFHSFSRNHNIEDAPPQDPAEWPSVAKAARIALTFRYQYLPYLYSLHYQSSLSGSTVVRPLFFEFPSDTTTMDVDRQFMWGDAIMIAPALDPGVQTVHAYFPSATWYSLIPETYGQKMDVGYSDVPARNDSLTPVFIRGGSIVPRQGANTTTTASRLNPMELMIAMNPIQYAAGYLFWDAGDDLVDDINSHKRHKWTFSFRANETAGTLTGSCLDCDPSVLINTLDVIEMIGYDYTPNFNSFNLDGAKVKINVQTSAYSPITRRLYISTKSLIPLQQYAGVAANTFQLTWTHTRLN